MLKRIKDFFNRKKENEPTIDDKIDSLFDRLYNDTMLIQLGCDLSEFGEEFCNIINELREEVKEECGFIIPRIHIQDNTALQENEYKIFIRGNLAENGFLIPNVDGIREEFYDVFKTIIYEKVDAIFTNEVAEKYLDTVQRKNGWLVWNITRILSVPDIKIILSDIINNGKSINDIGYVFEKIGEQILLGGGYQNCCKTHNPHDIAKKIVKTL